jgi:hypothetical protein
MVLAFIMDMLILIDADEIEFHQNADAVKDEKNVENLLKTRKMSEDIPNEDIPMK